MTMIAFATYGDRAEIITDTTSYMPNGTSLGRCSKVITIPHLDAAIATQGDTLFGSDAKSAALQAAGQVTTFDELVDSWPRVVRDLWARRVGEWAGATQSVTFLIGYSPRAESFTAWGFASDLDNFEPFAIDTWTTPCPWSLRPAALEAQRFLDVDAEWAAKDGAEPIGPRFVDEQWSTMPALAPPATVDEWVALAKRIRKDRAIDDRFPHTFVAGDVFHVRISRDEITSRKVHSFDDEGEEFLRMVEGTQHPFAQLMDCWCGSSELFINCHLSPELDEPCGCKRSDATLRECCAADVLKVGTAVGVRA